MGLISFITGSDNRKHIKKIESIAAKIEKLEDDDDVMEVYHNCENCG